AAQGQTPPNTPAAQGQTPPNTPDAQVQTSPNTAVPAQSSHSTGTTAPSPSVQNRSSSPPKNSFE
ncbi:MAG: hypothetical protein O3A80_04330, partial [bacterium]|nr:hypothetical protein [bacterium]